MGVVAAACYATVILMGGRSDSNSEIATIAVFLSIIAFLTSIVGVVYAGVRSYRFYKSTRIGAQTKAGGPPHRILPN